MAGVHEGHRERLRMRIEREGVRDFQQHEILEFLLYYATGRGDMNPAAHALMDEFGCLEDVMRAQMAQTQRVEGVGRRSAEWLRHVGALMDGYARLESGDRPPLGNLRDVRAFAGKCFAQGGEDEVWQLCMGRSGRLLLGSPMAGGSAWGECGPLRDALSEVLAVHASSVVFLQFTGARAPEPEEYDVERTCAYAHTLTAVGVHLLDHVLVGAGRVYSMAREGRLKDIARPQADASVLMERYLWEPDARERAEGSGTEGEN